MHAVNTSSNPYWLTFTLLAVPLFASSTAVPVPPALLKAMEEGGRAMDIAAMQQCVYREERSLSDTEWGGLQPAAGGNHQAVLINPGWACEGRGDAAVQVGLSNTECFRSLSCCMPGIITGRW